MVEQKLGVLKGYRITIANQKLEFIPDNPRFISGASF